MFKGFAGLFNFFAVKDRITITVTVKSKNRHSAK